MYFETKFSKKMTLLLRLQEPKGGSVTLGTKNDVFWDFKQGMDGSSLSPTPQSFVVVQPLIMFNKIESSNVSDVPIQDHDVILTDATDVNDARIDQEIVCWDQSDTTITAYFDTSKKTLDDYYTCKTDLKITGDISDLEDVEEVLETLEEEEIS